MAEFSNVADAQAYSPATAPDFIRTAGYWVAGDTGGALYKKVNSQPVHLGKFSITLSDGMTVVWYEVTVDLSLTVNAYGARADNTNATNGTDNTAAIQAMINHTGFYRLGLGRYKITSTLRTSAGAGASTGAHFTGVGKEKSILVSSGMAGKAMFGPPGDGLFRIHMSHHQMIGDSDTCIDFTLVSGQLYESSFRQMALSSQAGPSFVANRHFATVWDGCSFSSASSHSLLLAGGNSTVLLNCYAHQCGDDRANFRIGSTATLLSCLGGDKTTGPSYVFHFGGDPFATGTTAVYQMHILGGNAEDFGTAALAVESSGQLVIENLAVVARASVADPYETFIKMISGTGHAIYIRGNTRGISKGAPRSGNANIQGTGGAILVENSYTSADSQFSTYYNTTASLLYDVPVLQVRGGEYSKLDLQISRLKSLRESGFVSPVPTTITAGSTTFSATGANCLKTANTSATSLAQLTGGIDGQGLRLMIGDSYTTLKHNTGGSGRFILKSGFDESPAAGKVYEFVWFNSVWQQP